MPLYRPPRLPYRLLWALVPLLFHAPSGLAGVAAEVVIEGYQFTPAEVRIKLGDSVRWTNHEKRTSHSVVFSGEGGFESDRLFPDESFEHRFDTAGRFEYHCEPHPEMKGRVLVEP